ncbi:MAG: hypothetical protein RIR00_1936 [Pseudomonadota bacterium]|jgi:spermidine synthase
MISQHARLLSFCVGFLSLSQEILWIRLTGFAFRGTPLAFGVILGLYLIGIAIGAGLGKRYCRKQDGLFQIAAVFLMLGGIADLIFPWLTVQGFAAGKVGGGVMLGLCVVLTAMFKSAVFPIAHHLGSSTATDRVGSSVSKVYFANILGATLGPLLTGFFLLNVLTLQQCLLLMGGLTLATAAFCWWAAQEAHARPLLASSLLLSLGLLFLPPLLLPQLVELTAEHEGEFALPVENRYGIIHVLQTHDGDDYVFGGNAYDGRVGYDFLRDTNLISRAYLLAALQPEARRVLVIGASAGAWTRVLTAFPKVERIDIVEINPGYLKITAQYPELRPILSDPRVHFHFDDGRRWLKRHPEEKFDMVVMNNTYHWRAYSTLLLSREFLQQLDGHLNHGGLIAYNSTWSWDAFATAASVFPQVYRYLNCVIAGRQVGLPAEADALERLAALQLDGKPLLDLDNPAVLAKAKHNLWQLHPFNEDNTQRPLEIITDQNMLTEYKRGKSLWSLIHKE